MTLEQVFFVCKKGVSGEGEEFGGNTSLLCTGTSILPPVIGRGPRGKPNTTVLLKERSNKMTLDDILLYSEISAFPSHHQRCSLLQYMGANTESTTDDMQ